MFRKNRTDGNSILAVTVNLNRLRGRVALARYEFDHDIYVDGQADIAWAR